MEDAVRQRFERVRQVTRLERPNRLPLSEHAVVQYRPEVYAEFLSRPELTQEVAPGETGVSADGRYRFTRIGQGVTMWGLGDPEKYRDETDVLNTDPDSFVVESVNPTMLCEMQSLYDKAAQERFPIPMQYGTCYTRAQVTFGWEPFLMASAVDPERFGRILDRFGEGTVAVVQGWAELDCTEVIAVHDDIAATRGPISSPEWFRRYVFPWYARIFDAIHARGKKVLYISDGNYMPVLDDILATNPDGLYIETSSMDPGELMRRAGKDKFFMVKTCNRTMDVGTPEEIYAELSRLRELHEEYPGIMMYRGGGNPNRKNQDAFERYYQELLVYG